MRKRALMYSRKPNRHVSQQRKHAASPAEPQLRVEERRKRSLYRLGH